MKYYKVLVNLTLWHLRPYKYKWKVAEKEYIEYGFLCFKYVVGGGTNKN